MKYNSMRKELRFAIRKAQEVSWKALCDLVDNDPWGVPYRLVTKRLGRQTHLMGTSQARNIEEDLFPALSPVHWPSFPIEPAMPTELEVAVTDDRSFPPVTTDELLRAANKLPNNKAPSLDQK